MIVPVGRRTILITGAGGQLGCALQSSFADEDVIALAHADWDVTAEYDPADPDEHGIRWDDPRVRHLWATQEPVLSARDAAASQSR